MKLLTIERKAIVNDYDDTNRGVLFKNNRKATENQPDYTGKLNIEGTERYLSAWIKESKAGNKFFSMSLGKPVAEVQEKGSASAKTADFVDSEIPF